MTVTIGRRELLAALGGAAAWPLAARAQQADDAGGRVSVSTTNSLLTISPGREFTSNAWCHRRLAPNAPLDPNDRLITNRLLHDMTSAAGALYLSGMPIFVVEAGVPTVPVKVVADPGAWTDQLTAQFAAGVPIPLPSSP